MEVNFIIFRQYNVFFRVDNCIVIHVVSRECISVVSHPKVAGDAYRPRKYEPLHS